MRTTGPEGERGEFPSSLTHPQAKANRSKKDIGKEGLKDRWTGRPSSQLLGRPSLEEAKFWKCLVKIKLDSKETEFGVVG